MGSIAEHNIQKFKEDYNLNAFVETGTGLGGGLNWAIQNSNFTAYLSCELYKEVFNKIHIQSPKCFLFECDSLNFFKQIQPLIEKANCLFWLDAHFPGADFGYENYMDNKFDENLSLPLLNELDFLVNNKNILNDVFIIDDWRIYEDNSYQHGNSDIKRFEQRIIIENLFQKTHNLVKDFRHEGYLICTPKK
jgi:hypothetical protein